MSKKRARDNAVSCGMAWRSKGRRAAVDASRTDALEQVEHDVLDALEVAADGAMRPDVDACPLEDAEDLHEDRLAPQELLLEDRVHPLGRGGGM